MNVLNMYFLCQLVMYYWIITTFCSYYMVRTTRPVCLIMAALVLVQGVTDEIQLEINWHNNILA